MSEKTIESSHGRGPQVRAIPRSSASAPTSRAWNSTRRLYDESIKDPVAFWAEERRGAALVRPLAQGYSWDKDEAKIKVVRGRQAQRQLQLRRPSSRPAGRTRRPSSGRGRGRTSPHLHLPAAAPRGLQVRQRAQVQGSEEGRPRLHLPAHDPRAGHRHAGLRPHRRDPQHRLRRIHLRGAQGPHQRQRLQDAHHRRRQLPRRQAGHAEAATPTPPWRRGTTIENVIVVKRAGAECVMEDGPRLLVARGDGQGLAPQCDPAGWTRRTRCSSSTPPAPPASPRACCTPPAATWSSPH